MNQRISWEFPYHSQRAPVVARNVVATSQPLATAAGLKILYKGGNAVDAIIAAAITLSVVEPCSNGLGSDAFALIHDGSQLHGINGSGRSPGEWNLEGFKNYTSMPLTGWDTVTVPGAVDVWRQLSSRFGTLPFETLFDDAVHYAREGFHVGHITARAWASAQQTFRDFEYFQEHFLPNGVAPRPSELFKRKSLANTLERIARSNGEDFYQGELAKAIVEQSSAEGGCMSLDDLSSHESEWVEPISYEYGDVRLHEIPPNGQGIAALLALGILDRLNARRFAVDSIEWLHAQTESMKLAIRAVFDHVADTNAMQLNVRDIVNPRVLDALGGADRHICKQQSASTCSAFLRHRLSVSRR